MALEIHRLRKSNSSGDVFSFPRTLDKDCDEFEFGCVTRPGSPPGDPAKDSPADHLFFNGRLLPHAFPAQLSSRASSASSSRDSLTTSSSSRSNSANSRSSSARTSSSDGCDRRLWTPAQLKPEGPTSKDPPIPAEKMRRASLNRSSGGGGSYGSSHRWQFIAAAPALKPAAPAELPRRKRVESEKRQASGEKKTAGEGPGICRRVLRSLAAACRECHSMEPSAKR